MGQVAAVGVVADLVAVAQDVERILALEHLEHEVGHDVDRASFTLPLMTSVSRSARRSPIPTQLNGRRIVYGSPYCSQAPLAKYSEASFWKPYVEIGGGEVALGALGRREDGRRLVDHR